MTSAITDDVATLIERLQGHEAFDWEIKAARNAVPGSIWETISAFANTQGGWLMLGVAERDHQSIVEGVMNPEEQVRTIHDQLRNTQKISQSVCGAADISIVEVSDKQVVVIRVPPAPRRSRPIYTRGNPYNGTYVRRDEGDYPATRSEVDRMMREASDVPADHVIVDGYTWDDLDRSTFIGYRRRFQTANPESPHNILSDQDFLTVISGFRRDRETGRSGLTVAGLLMFGTDEAIRSWRGRHLIDLRVVEGALADQVTSAWTDRITWEGNLLGAFESLYRKIIDGLPVPFAVADGVRMDHTDQQIAVREAFVNLLLHADYSDQSVSLIIRSGDGYSFRNPGSSRVPDLDPASGDRSDPRNPGLVRMFRLIGLAEEAGSGVPRMVRAWRGLGYESPSFDLGLVRHEFGVRLSFLHLLSESDRDWLASLALNLTEDEQLALVIARHDGSVDNAALRQVTGRQVLDVSRILGGLRDRSLLRMIGAKRGARYELADAVRDFAVQDKAADLIASQATNSADLPGSSADLPGSSADLPGSSADSEHQAARLEQLARPVAASGRLDATVRDNVILQLCAISPLSLVEISTLLQRDPAYVRQVIRSLVKSGQLLREFSDKPNHPNQRYLTPELTRQG